MTQRIKLRPRSKVTKRLNVRRTDDILPLANATLSDSIAGGIVTRTLEHTCTKSTRKTTTTQNGNSSDVTA